MVMALSVIDLPFKPVPHDVDPGRTDKFKFSANSAVCAFNRWPLSPSALSLCRWQLAELAWQS